MLESDFGVQFQQLTCEQVGILCRAALDGWGLQYLLAAKDNRTGEQVG